MSLRRRMTKRGRGKGRAVDGATGGEWRQSRHAQRFGAAAGAGAKAGREMNSNRIRTDILHAVMLREQIAGVRKRDAVAAEMPPSAAACAGRKRWAGRASGAGAYARSRRRGRRNERMTRDKPAGRVGTRAGCESKKLHSPCKNAVQGCANDQHAKKCGPPARPRARKRAIKGGRTHDAGQAGRSAACSSPRTMAGRFYSTRKATRRKRPCGYGGRRRKRTTQARGSRRSPLTFAPGKERSAGVSPRRGGRRCAVCRRLGARKARPPRHLRRDAARAGICAASAACLLYAAFRPGGCGAPGNGRMRLRAAAGGAWRAARGASRPPRGKRRTGGRRADGDMRNKHRARQCGGKERRREA